MKTLNLSCNQITEINSTLFQYSYNITDLYLENKLISSIQGSTFNGLKYLKFLNTTSNRLTKIDSDTFIGLNNLVSYL